LTRLKTLNLAENPLSSTLPGYRLLVVKNLPNLEKLDDIQISYAEKEQAMSCNEEEILARMASNRMEYVSTSFMPTESQ